MIFQPFHVFKYFNPAHFGCHILREPISFGSIPVFRPQRSVNALWFVQDSHLLCPPSGFVTAIATPVLSIFTSCSGYSLSIFVGSKCAILHSLSMHFFNVNMLHVQSCMF